MFWGGNEENVDEVGQQVIGSWLLEWPPEQEKEVMQGVREGGSERCQRPRGGETVNGKEDEGGSVILRSTMACLPVTCPQ